jgi:hypothetical protein
MVFDVDINSSADPTKCILKWEKGGSQDSGLASQPSGQKREGCSFGSSAYCQLSNCQMSKSPAG